MKRIFAPLVCLLVCNMSRAELHAGARAEVVIIVPTFTAYAGQRLPDLDLNLRLTLVPDLRACGLFGELVHPVWREGDCCILASVFGGPVFSYSSLRGMKLERGLPVGLSLAFGYKFNNGWSVRGVVGGFVFFGSFSGIDDDIVALLPFIGIGAEKAF